MTYVRLVSIKRASIAHIHRVYPVSFEPIGRTLFSCRP